MPSPFRSSGRCLTVLSGLRLLVVEDDADSRELYAFILGQRGAVVTSVGSAGEALDALERSRFSALVSDIGLPDEDGYSLMKKVRLRSRGLGGRMPAVAVTAYTDAESRMRARDAGFEAFVPKPMENSRLVGVLAVLARPVAVSRRLLEDLTRQTGDPPSLRAELEALLAERQAIRTEARRLRLAARQLRCHRSSS